MVWIIWRGWVGFVFSLSFFFLVCFVFGCRRRILIWMISISCISHNASCFVQPRRHPFSAHKETRHLSSMKVAFSAGLKSYRINPSIIVDQDGIQCTISVDIHHNRRCQEEGRFEEHGKVGMLSKTFLNGGTALTSRSCSSSEYVTPPGCK